MSRFAACWRPGRLTMHGPAVSLLAALFAAFLPCPATAQQLASPGDDEPLYVVPRLAGPIDLDGRVDEPAWEGVEPLSAVMHLPAFGAEPSERTEFQLAHDGKYLYFACLAYDSQPDGIQVTSLRRDATTRADDNCALYLDTFNDEENALTFMTTPSGRRIDQALANDAEGGPNFDWNTFWDTAVTRDEQGWFVEMRIPFSSLLFQTENGQVVMGMSIRRLVARKNEIITHPAVSPSLGSDSYRKPSLMRKIALEGVERVDPIYVTPYALGGWGRMNALSREERVYNRLIDRVAEAGLDVKYGLTSNLGLDLSVNTDFAQVEADDQQVNLTRFSLFFPEKRRFFQERAAIFEYPLGGNERLFHSRNIGLADGEPVRIYGGGRVVGRVGDWDVGFLDMQTADSDQLPSENDGVLRVRRRVLNPNSYVGAITTSRLAIGGHHNVVYGFDGLFRIVGFDYLTVNWAQSFDGREPAGSIRSTGPFDRALARVNWERRGQDGLLYAFDLTRAGDTFEPGLGFLLRRNYAKADGSLGHGWRPQGTGLLRYSLRVDGTVVRRLEDGTVETVEAGPVAVLETRGRRTWTFSIPVRHENLTSEFSLPENTYVPAGSYDFTGGRLQYQAPQGDRLRPNVTFEAGQFYDGRQASLSIGTDWNPSMHLFLGGTYRRDYVEFPDRQGFTAHVARLRAEVMFTTKTSALGFVQFNSTQNAVIGNFRFHYTAREGNDLYIVWNENLTTNRLSFDPVRPLSNERTIMVKYSHTIPFGI